MISIAAIEKPACPRCNKTTIAKKEGWLNDADATATVTWECPRCRRVTDACTSMHHSMIDLFKPRFCPNCGKQLKEIEPWQR